MSKKEVNICTVKIEVKMLSQRFAKKPLFESEMKKCKYCGNRRFGKTQNGRIGFNL